MNSSNLNERVATAKSHARAKTLSTRALTAAAVGALSLLAPLGGATAHADNPICSAGGSITTCALINANGTLEAQWGGTVGEYDKYNLLWHVSGQPNQPQQEIAGNVHDEDITNAAAGTTYIVSVQGCNNNTLAPATCTPWNTTQVTDLASGPGTCKPGFVWRGANPSDHVCVTPQDRTLTAQQNAEAASHVNPNGGAYGPGTCLQGYVFRDAYNGDQVCVTPDARSQAAADNAAAASHTA